MADHSFPGGGWHMGAGAQEESIFYRSNYFKILNTLNVQYPINDTVAIYSKGVTVFRDNNLDICPSWDIDIVTVAAIPYQHLINGHLEKK